MSADKSATQDIDDLIARLEAYNPPDRCFDDDRKTAQDIMNAAAALRDQRDEVARLQKLEQQCWTSHEQWMAWCDIRMLERAERAEAERDAAMRDAERIDWLDKNPREATIRIGGDMKACVFYGVSCDPKWSAREAIDAAMKGKS